MQALSEYSLDKPNRNGDIIAGHINRRNKQDDMTWSIMGEFDDGTRFDSVSFSRILENIDFKSLK